MSSSSQLPEYSITLDDISTTSLTSSNTIDTITLTGGGSGYYTIGTGLTASVGSINIASGATSASSTFFTNINGGTITNSSASWNFTNTEWKTSFPDWTRVQTMCKQYPGLEIAFRNFKNTYNLVKDDYDNPNTKK